MTPDMPPPGWPASMRAARVRDLEAAIAAATGKAPQRLDRAERLPLQSLAKLIEAFQAAEALAADPVGALAARVERADRFLERIGEDQRPNVVDLIACLRKLRTDLGALVAILDRLLSEHGGKS